MKSNNLPTTPAPLPPTREALADAALTSPRVFTTYVEYLGATLAARTAELRQARAELDAVEPERLRLLELLNKRDKGENAAIWRLTRKITDTFREYGKKFGGPAVAHDKRFWASIADEWYDDIKAALWPGRADVFEPFTPARTPPAPAGPGEAGGAAVAGVAQVCARCGQQCDADCENDGRWYDGPLVECPCCKGEGARLMRCDACENTGKVPAALSAARTPPAPAGPGEAGGAGDTSNETNETR